jgi:membrane fusion protein, multidrug efflux system
VVRQRRDRPRRRGARRAAPGDRGGGTDRHGDRDGRGGRHDPGARGGASAEAELGNARQLLERAEALVEGSTVSRAQVATLRSDVEVKVAALAAQQARLAERTVLAPFAGTLGIRQVSLGALVSPGDAIVTLDDLTRMRVDFDLPEVLLAQLRPGLELQVRSDTYPDRAFTATVTSIDTRIDPATRSVATVAEIDNRDGLLRPGMFLSVRVILSTDDDAVLIPEQALVPQGTQQYVYVVADGKAARREVAIGSRQSGMVEVRSGLAPGESVVIEGTQRLRDGAAVTVEAAETGAAS